MAVENVSINFNINSNALTSTINSLKKAKQETTNLIKELNKINKVKFTTLVNNLNNVGKSATNTTKQATKLNTALKNAGNGNSASNMAKSFNNVDKAVSKLSKNLGKIKSISINNLNSQFKQLQTRITSTNSSLNKISTSARQLGSASGNFSIKINSVSTSKLNAIKSAFNTIKTSVNGATSAVNKFKNAINSISTNKLNTIRNAFNSIRSSINNTSTSTNRFRSSINSLNASRLNTIRNGFNSIRSNVNNATTTVNRFRTSINSINANGLNTVRNGFNSIRTSANSAISSINRLRNATSKLSNLSSSLSSIGQNLTSLGRNMTMYVTTPIAAGLGASVKRSMDFNQQIKNTGALTGATAKEMSKLKEQALDLGNKTKYSALEVAKGQTELMKAGRNLKQVFAEMSDVLNLAAAGDLKVAKASEITANMMNMFSKEGVSAKKVADLMAGAANQSAIDVSEFYTSMSYVGGIASSLGIPLKDVSSVIAILGNNAVKGSRAGTGLRQFLSRLQPASEKAEGAMRDLGIITEDGANKFYTAKGKIKSFNDIIDVLRKSTEGLTDKEKQQKLDVMFGKIASPSLMALIKENSSAIDDMAKRIGKISAASVAAKKLDTFAGAVEFLSGSIETFAVKVGDSLTPILKIFAQVLTKVFDKLYKLPKSVLGAISVFAIFIATIGPCVMIMGLFVTAIAALLTPVGLATTAIGALIGVGALGGLIALLSAYTGGGEGLKESLGSIKDKAIEIYNYLKDIWVPGIKFLLTGDKKELSKIEDKGFKDSLEEARKSIETLSKTVGETVKMINKDIGAISTTDLNTFSKNVVSLVKNLSDATSMILEVVQAIKEVYDFIKKVDLELQISAAEMNDAMPKFMQTENRGGKTLNELKSERLKYQMSDTKEAVTEYKRKVKIATTFEEREDAQKELDKYNNKLEKQIKEYEKLTGKASKKVKVDTKVETKLDGVYESEKELKKAIEKELKGNKKIEIDGSLKDEKLAKKVEDHNNNLKLKLQSGEINSIKTVNFDANVQDANAKIKIDMSNQSITDRSRIKIPDVLKNWNTSANINDSSAKSSADVSNTQIKTKAHEKIPDPTKNIKVSASVDNSSALTSVYNAMQGIIAYATGFAMPVIKKGIQVIGDVISGGGSTKKHALGTRYSLGGMALVGEQGAELVNLPKGSQVYNNQQTRSIMNNNNQRSININYSGGTSTQDKNNLVNMLRTAGVY